MSKKDQPIIIKKVKGHGHAHHGGSWKVAYADFVTAMMAFFMVMWIMGLSESDKEQISGYFNDPLGFMKNTPKMKVNISMDAGKNGKTQKLKINYVNSGDAGKVKDAAKAFVRQIQNKIKGDKDNDVKQLMQYVQMQITDRGIEIEFSERSGMVFFEVGSSTIRPAALKLIKTISPMLGQSHRKIEIKGHTDSRPMPNNSYTNVDLSADRAKAVHRAMLNSGVRVSQVLAYSGLGDTELKDKADPYSYVNRRVTVLLPFTSSPDEEPSLPKDTLDANTEAVFKKPLDDVRSVRIHP